MRAEIRQLLDKKYRSPQIKKFLNERKVRPSTPKPPKPPKRTRLSMILEQSCPVHNFRYISMPRDEGGDDFGYVAKCPFNSCPHGVHRDEDDGEFIPVDRPMPEKRTVQLLDVIERKSTQSFDLPQAFRTMAYDQRILGAASE